MKDIIQNEFNEHLNTTKSTMESIIDSVESAAKLCINCLLDGKKILIFGNGGSAADAQHIAAELTGRYKLSRKGLPAIALTTDSSALTAISNDFGYSNIFMRQVEALATKGDVLIGISTSGVSENIINAINFGSKVGCKTICMSGNNGGELNDICDINLVVSAIDTPRIQEVHIIIGHIICHLIDLEFDQN